MKKVCKVYSIYMYSLSVYLVVCLVAICVHFEHTLTRIILWPFNLACVEVVKINYFKLNFLDLGLFPTL